MSYSKVRAICRVATPATEAELVEVGLSATAGQVERLTRCIRSVAPEHVPSAPPPQEPRPPRLSWEWQDDGTLRISGRLTAEDGAALLAALGAVAQAGQGDRDSIDVPAVRSSRAGSVSTGVVGQTAQLAAEGVNAGRSGAPAELVVHVDADLITRLRAEADRELSRGHVDDGPALALATIERLACDGRVRLASHGSDGRTLDLGRSRRRPTARQLRTLVRRDGGCTVPGCGRTRFLHAHHVVFWSRGGETSMDNLLLLCGQHHRALHDLVFSIEGLGRQRFRFRDRDQTVIDYAPRLHGRTADLDAAHALVDGETITPDWYGDRLYPDLMIEHYVRSRTAEGAVSDPWEAAA